MTEIESSNAAVAKIKRKNVADYEIRLQQWINTHIVGYEHARIERIETPSAGGLSGDTMVITIEAEKGRPSGWHKLVVRKKVVEMVTNPQINFSHQIDAQTFLGNLPDVPVPRVLGVENSSELLGVPFFIMEFVDGNIPSDVPPYSSSGWVFEATEVQRAAMWQSGMNMLAKIHNVDISLADLDHLTIDASGSNDNERFSNRFIDLFLSESAGYQSETCNRAIEWLQDNCPEPETRSICWGDARIGNIIWQNFDCVSVIDWDMCSLGCPGIDVGWWSFFHRWSTSGQGFPVMSGTLVGQPLADLYHHVGGIKIKHMRFYEILATLRGMSVWIRTFKSLREQGLIADMSPIDESIHIVKVLRDLLNEREV